MRPSSAEPARQHAPDAGTSVVAYIMVDVEADGPIPGDYSMICFGAVLVREPLDQTFYGRLKPISDKWSPEAPAVSGFAREETLRFDEPGAVMRAFEQWLTEHAGGRAAVSSLMPINGVSEALKRTQGDRGTSDDRVWRGFHQGGR
jgi:hypothetical protein